MANKNVLGLFDNAGQGGGRHRRPSGGGMRPGRLRRPHGLPRIRKGRSARRPPNITSTFSLSLARLWG